MKEINLSREQLDDLIEQHSCCQDRRQAYRLNVIILLAKGYTHKDVADALLIDERTSRRYKEIFFEKGSDGLLEFNHQGSSAYLNEAQQEQLREHLRNKIYLRAADIARYIKNTFKVIYTKDGLVPLLHKLGFVYKKSKQLPGKQPDTEEQKAFVKKYQKTQKKLGKNDVQLFMDATHPAYNSIAAYGWIEKGKEAYIPSNSGRKHLNINGVINPKTGDIIAADYPTVNTEATMDLLIKIRKYYGWDGKIILYADRARYNYARAARRLAHKLKIKIEYLPTYSPQLNLIERLWHLLKKEVLYHKYYATYEDFRTAVLSFLNNKSKTFRNQLNSLMTENFHIFNSS